jgi:hypothetical protein
MVQAFHPSPQTDNHLSAEKMTIVATAGDHDGSKGYCHDVVSGYEKRDDKCTCHLVYGYGYKEASSFPSPWKSDRFHMHQR